jgi:putative nucleotidyltransferase with HDIG domain
MALSFQTTQAQIGESTHVLTATEVEPVSTSALALLDVPPLPALAIKALRMVSDNEARLRELHALVAADQAFCAEILKIVNSPLYGTRFEITSIMQAMMLLGFERVRGLLLTIGMRSLLNGVCAAGAVRACWRHSLAAALIAEQLAEASGLDKDIAYTGALIHDIGRLGIITLRPQQYADLVAASEEQPCDTLEEERRRFGIDHCAAGRFLVTAWKLPSAFVDVTGSHHSPGLKQDPLSGMLSVVRLSCALCDAIGFEVVRCFAKKSYEELVCQLPAGVRNRFPKNQDDLRKHITETVNSIEAL